jgi:hypothetical protein
MPYKRKPIVEIVSHCYAMELPQYAALLNYQLSSLRLYPPRLCDALVDVCCLGLGSYCTDTAVRGVLEFHRRSWEEDARVAVGYTCYDLADLGRRAIGRNNAARASEGDIVWFSDVDQVFGEGCLDRLATMEWPKGATMVFPRQVMIHKDHATGDKAAEIAMRNLGHSLDITSPDDFVPKDYARAIGGVQIVRGDFARQYGYLGLPGYEKWLRPNEKPFGSFRDDIAYRKFCLKHGTIEPVDLPGLYRMRHSKTTYR